MENRRTFLKKSVTACAAAATAGCLPGTAAPVDRPFRTRAPKKALVLWYSQTGHTRRYGEVIARTFRKNGVPTDVGDIRWTKPGTLGGYDLVVAGTPVHYYDVPENVAEQIRALDRIEGAGAAAYATFGGPGNNQHNTACSLLSLLVEKGGVPLGIACFGNMSTYAPTWSLGNEERILKYRHFPDAATYDRVRTFAENILFALKQGRSTPVEKQFDLDEVLRHLPSRWAAKLMTTTHAIDPERCIGCGTCRRVCPVGAMDPDHHRVLLQRCIACLGCVNNCPAGAVTMEFLGKKVYGFNDFLDKHKIRILEP